MTKSDPGKEAVQSLLNRQRNHWLEGRRIRPEDLTVDLAEDATYSEVLLELIHQEILLREESGELPTLEEYQRRYPKLADALRIQWALDLAMMGETDQLNHDSPEPAVRKIGRYVLCELLGKGAMGIVYKAMDPELKRLSP